MAEPVLSVLEAPPSTMTFRVSTDASNVVPTPTPLSTDESFAPGNSDESSPQDSPDRDADMTNNSEDNMQVVVTSPGGQAHQATESEDEVPAAKRRKTNKAGDTLLSIRDPVGELPFFVWRLIWENAHPTVLMISSTLCKAFHQYLAREECGLLWKSARLREMEGHFWQTENVTPEAPNGMTEKRYGTLLFGSGCDFQHSVCGNSRVRTVQWVFGVRLCEPCLVARTEKNSSLVPGLVGAPTINKLLPWMEMKERFVHDYHRLPHTLKGVYLRADILRLREEYLGEEVSDMEEDEYDVWLASKEAIAQAIRAHAAEIDAACHSYAVTQPKPQHRRSRMQFFVDKALRLDPPIHRDVLELMLPFQTALKAKCEPTEEAWLSLKSKIEPLREDARILQQKKRKMIPSCGGRPPYDREIDAYGKLHNKITRYQAMVPTHRRSPAYSVIDSVLDDISAQGVADGDFVALVLEEVFRRYESARSQTTDLRIFPELTMNDAKMMVQQVITPFLKEDYCTPLEVSMVLENFKCLACVKTKKTSRFTFVKLFNHIYEKHATMVDEDHDFHTLFRVYNNTTHSDCYELINDCGFPWHTVRWPKNLPLVGEHFKPQQRISWRANSDEPYQTAPPLPPSLFLNRGLCSNPRVSFANDVYHALDKLSPTLLEPFPSFAIALEYGLRRQRSISWYEPVAIEDLTAVYREILTTKNSQYHEYAKLRFACWSCNHHERPKLGINNPNPSSLPNLVLHWKYSHQEYRNPEIPPAHPLDWTKYMLQLPSGAELARSIQEADTKLEKELGAARARGKKRARDPKMKESPKDRLMEMKVWAGPVIDELFPPLNGGRVAAVDEN